MTDGQEKDAYPKGMQHEVREEITRSDDSPINDNDSDETSAQYYTTHLNREYPEYPRANRQDGEDAFRVVEERIDPEEANDSGGEDEDMSEPAGASRNTEGITKVQINCCTEDPSPQSHSPTSLRSSEERSQGIEPGENTSTPSIHFKNGGAVDDTSSESKDLQDQRMERNEQVDTSRDEEIARSLASVTLEEEGIEQDEISRISQKGEEDRKELQERLMQEAEERRRQDHEDAIPDAEFVEPYQGQFEDSDHEAQNDDKKGGLAHKSPDGEDEQ